mgnify:CR=1 FL=1
MILGWKIWKSPEERANEEREKGISFRNQSRWREAADHFEKAAKLYEEAGLAKEARICYALSSLYAAANNPTPDNLMECSRRASALEPSTILEIPQKCSAGDLATETRLLAEEEVLLSLIREKELQNIDISKAVEFQRLGSEFLSLSREKFIVSNLFQCALESPIIKGTKLLGIAELINGYSALQLDPLKAVEHFSAALSYFKNANYKEGTTLGEKLVNKSKQVGKCWFCGRLVQGEDVHFVRMRAVITPYLISKCSDEATPSIINNTYIIACYACYSAINIAADIIAKTYYEKAMEALQRVREELLERIIGLQQEISEIKTSLDKIYTMIPRR